MSIATAKFPTSVWDRSTKTRGTDPQIDREPSFGDYDQVVAEMIAVETALFAGLNGTNVKPIAFGGGDTKGAIPVLFTFTVTNSATNFDIVVAEKCQVLDAFLVKTGSTGSTSDAVQVKHGTTALSDSLALNTVAAKTVVRAAQIDQAQALFAAGDTLRVTSVKTTDCSCVVVVMAQLVP